MPADARPSPAAPHQTPPSAARGPSPADGGGTHQITVTDEQDLPVDVAHLERLAAHVLTTLAIPRELELAITCSDRARITELNEAHLQGTGTTDVLAFPIDAPGDVVAGVPGLLGDVVVCPAVAAAQAPEHGRTPEGEVDLLVVHGILHLLGHDHAEPGERAEMFGLTDELLTSFATQAVP